VTEFAKSSADEVEQTSGHLLDGRVRYAQPRHGFRSGIEPVLLAASVPATPGERVLEAGTGAGAALLCLAARVPRVLGVGVDQHSGLVTLAAQNATANNWATLRFIAADVATLPDLGQFDHACANAPYHLAGGTASPDASRQVAKHARVDLLTVWATALARPLRGHGTLTFILPAALLPECALAFAAAGCRPIGMLPLWPKVGQPAKLMLLRGVKGSNAPFRVLPGLVLHELDGRYTPAADAVLRRGGALEL
jgi:tRNA1(Val) A37 N6-methylase TrmN6